jgi:hypothetical protein
MRYLKTYEENSNEPQVGDYVICNFISNHIGKINCNFISNHIGKIIMKKKHNFYPYNVFYENAPNIYFGISKTIVANRNNIIHFSKIKKDLEVYIDANKYNL